MDVRDRLRVLLNTEEELKPWLKQRTRAKHFKRINIDENERDRLANIGATELYDAFGVIPYYTQAIIAGAMLSGDYDKITAVTSWQTGKSWLMGHCALLLARKGEPVYVAANTAKQTAMIMGNVYLAVREANSSIKKELSPDNVKKVDKFGSSLSRERVAYMTGGFVESITLGGTFEDLNRAGAIGRGGVYILDEAALIPEKAHAETLRSNFARTDGKNYIQVAISNPHQSGWFYNDLTKEEPDPRHLIIWMDALTALQDCRWSKEKILREAEDMRRDDISRYLLCELPSDGVGIFPEPILGKSTSEEPAIVLGVDAAYKGKDNIEVCKLEMDGDQYYCPEIWTLNKKNWVDGKTSQEIIDTIARIYFSLGALLVCVDVGQGIWLVQGLANKGVNVREVNFAAMPTKKRVEARHYAATNAKNLRAEMHLDLQMLMDSKHITFSESVIEGIKKDLPLVTSERKENGKIQIRPKSEIRAITGHSPDKLDALLLGLHAAILLAGT